MLLVSCATRSRSFPWPLLARLINGRGNKDSISLMQTCSKTPSGPDLEHIWWLILMNGQLSKISYRKMKCPLKPATLPRTHPTPLWDPGPFTRCPFAFHARFWKRKAGWKYLFTSCGWLVYTQITKSDYKFVNVFACRERPILLMVIKLNYPVHLYLERKSDPCSPVSLHNIDV